MGVGLHMGEGLMSTNPCAAHGGSGDGRFLSSPSYGTGNGLVLLDTVWIVLFLYYFVLCFIGIEAPPLWRLGFHCFN